MSTPSTANTHRLGLGQAGVYDGSQLVDPVGEFRDPLIEPLESLFLLREPPIHALEPFDDFGAYLLQPHHGR